MIFFSRIEVQRFRQERGWVGQGKARRRRGGGPPLARSRGRAEVEPAPPAYLASRARHRDGRDMFGMGRKKEGRRQGGREGGKVSREITLLPLREIFQIAIRILSKPSNDVKSIPSSRRDIKRRRSKFFSDRPTCSMQRRGHDEI